MKQLKLMVLALTLLMGTMFTSCMDSGENGPQQWAGVVKVNNEMYGMSFTDIGGLRLIPSTQPITSISSKMASIYCTIDEGQEINQNTKEVRVTLLQEPVGIDAPTSIVTEIGGGVILLLMHQWQVWNLRMGTNTRLISLMRTHSSYRFYSG